MDFLKEALSGRNRFVLVGLGPVFWLMISEIFPLKVRSPAMSLSTVGNWSANFLVSSFFLTLVGAISREGTFWLYAGFGGSPSSSSSPECPRPRAAPWRRSQATSEQTNSSTVTRPCPPTDMRAYPDVQR